MGVPSRLTAIWRRLRSRRYRPASAMTEEALQNRLDMKAASRYPTFLAGSHDWMTYRQRDHH